MTQESTLASAILDLLAAEGVDVVFGLPGVHTLAFWDALKPGHPRMIGVRHEQGAIYAADGYARATGRLGVAICTSGPGAANATAGFGEAHISGSSVLVIASDVNNALKRPAPRGILHEMHDQAAMFAAFNAPAQTVTNPDAAIRAVADALKASRRSPRGARYLGIPTDILGAPYSSDDAIHAELLALVEASQRPIIWAGGGVVQAGSKAEALLGTVAATLGAPIVTTYAGKGLLAEHPMTVDIPAHEPEVSDLIAQSDLLLCLGSGFDGMNTRNWKMPMPNTRIAIGLGDTLEHTIDWTMLIRADVTAALSVINEARIPARQPWVDPRAAADKARSRIAADPKTSDALEFVRAIESAWPASDPIVCDMSVSGYWVGGYVRQPRSRRLQYPVGWGTLGFGFPAAMGPAAAGHPTLAVCGDGGFMMSLGELATVKQENLPLTVLVNDDGGYGMLKFDQEVFGHPIRGVDLATPAWQTTVESFGIAFRETTLDALAADLRWAHENNSSMRPVVLLLRARFYPPRTTSPRWFEVESGSDATYG